MTSGEIVFSAIMVTVYLMSRSMVIVCSSFISYCLLLFNVLSHRWLLDQNKPMSFSFNNSFLQRLEQSPLSPKGGFNLHFPNVMTTAQITTPPLHLLKIKCNHIINMYCATFWYMSFHSSFLFSSNVNTGICGVSMSYNFVYHSYIKDILVFNLKFIVTSKAGGNNK